ncbi:MAG TPA: hypothetical protein VJP89_15025 [Pyrinomonadaceae bacterium]|nr:hypothetical protein [Pyrinomonadaceae bacterium]
MSGEIEKPKGLTVEQFCEYIAPSVWAEPEFLTWPPDVFAIVAALLSRSGAYSHAVSGWDREGELEKWTAEMKQIGTDWSEKRQEVPQKVKDWYGSLLLKRTTLVQDLCEDKTLCCMLIQLCAAADEACIGVGRPLPPGITSSPLRKEAALRLLECAQQKEVSTLCKLVHQSTVRVLPKLHTPQSGITIRSLTLNLALCPAGDVNVRWTECLPTERHCLNLLLVPWPAAAAPAHIKSVERERAVLRDLPKEFGFFEYDPPEDAGPELSRRARDANVLKRVEQLVVNARKAVSRIDGVVFPELALTAKQCDQISDALIKENIFLICGVRNTPEDGGKAAQNYLRFDVPFKLKPLSRPQHKHHRWRLDKRQIVQYGLGSCLDVAAKWWEHISVGSRELNFVALDDWLTVCPLICEDLARQDPISELVRAVGPNLVIALLMDGPQLPSRWPARYATVLADDPGSSVLTLTSIGMAELSRPPSAANASRAIALWKDAKTGEAFSIEMPPKKDGVVLSLSRELVKEYSADGRDDGETTGYPTLSGIHYVSAGESP